METSVSTLKLLVQQLLDQADEASDGADVSGVARAAFITVLGLREEHKRRCLDTEALKEQTNTSKTQLDQSSMQLQNLLYEKQHYAKEIQSCRNFTSEVTDEQVDLAPLPDFESSAPDHIKSTLDGTDHKLMIARLQYEKEQRQKLTADLQQLQQEKQQELQKLQQKKAKLEDLKAKLVAIGEQSKQLQPFISPPAGLKTPPSVAADLPTPLYIIYSQFAAAQQTLQLPVAVAVNELQDKPNMGLVVDKTEAEPAEGQDAKRRRSNSNAVQQGDVLKVGAAAKLRTLMSSTHAW
jgi:THO complex subunit 5